MNKNARNYKVITVNGKKVRWYYKKTVKALLRAVTIAAAAVVIAYMGFLIADAGLDVFIAEKDASIDAHYDFLDSSENARALDFELRQEAEANN